MISARPIIACLVASVLAVAGCASDGPPVSDPGKGVSARKVYGAGNKINLGAIFGRDEPAVAREQPVVDDPEYQEYLEWKRWQEFKEYQEWKRQQESGQPPAGEGQGS